MMCRVSIFIETRKLSEEKTVFSFKSCHAFVCASNESVLPYVDTATSSELTYVWKADFLDAEHALKEGERLGKMIAQNRNSNKMKFLLEDPLPEIEF